MIRINLLGVVYCLEAVLPEMLRRGRGHLAAVSSLAALDYNAAVPLVAAARRRQERREHDQAGPHFRHRNLVFSSGSVSAPAYGVEDPRRPSRPHRRRVTCL